MTTERPIVTFAVPCYNVAHCVEQCLHSILFDEALQGIEVLAIDDGSTDDTLSILQRLAEQHAALRVIHKENGGWGTAINLAINSAKGIYFKEIDADDKIETTSLRSYIDSLKEVHADIVVTPYADIMPNGSRTEHLFDNLEYNKIFSFAHFWSQYPDGWRFPIHAITYRTDFIRQLPLKVGPRYYSDFEYFLLPMPKVESLCVLPMTVTLYSRGSESQSTSAEGYAKHWTDMAALSLRLSEWNQNLDSSLPETASRKISETVQGTVRFAYELQMKYATVETLKTYDRQLHEASNRHWKLASKARYHSIPFIWLWRRLHINLFSLTSKRKLK